MTIAEWPETEG